MKTETRTSFRHALALTALLFAAPVFAGPPLLCHPFDTAGAPSLDWGNGKGWNQPLRNYDLAALGENTQALLTPQTPVVARMETLRRAAIYASREGTIARDLAARLDAATQAAQGEEAKALALFDAGYFRETLQEIVRVQADDRPPFDHADTKGLRQLLASGDGNARIEQALALRPGDASLHFAAALVAKADEHKGDSERHTRLARTGRGQDELLARNFSLIGP